MDQAGAQRGAVAIFRDVTAAEKALRNHSPGLSQAAARATPDASDWQAALEGLELYRGHYERLCRAVEQTADSVVITDRQARIEYVNPAFEATSGYTAQEVLGRKPSLLQSGQHDKQFFEALWAKLDAGEPWRGTIINRKKSGELYWSEQTISPMKDDAGRVTHFVSVLKDITGQRKQREQEFYLQLASEVQQHLYRGADSVTGFDMAGITCPADLTGGDYFDTIAHPDGRVTVAIGDVSGHGVGSALVMAATRAYIRAFTKSEADAATLLRHLNGALTADLNGGRFVTLMLIQVDPRTRSIEYAGAGHLPSYLLRGDGGVELVLGSTGPPLGLLAEAEFATCGPIAYGDGDAIVLFTDGVTEAVNADGQEFGAERALDTVRLHRRSSARELVEGLAEAVRTFCGKSPRAMTSPPWSVNWDRGPEPRSNNCNSRYLLGLTCLRAVVPLFLLLRGHRSFGHLGFLRFARSRLDDFRGLTLSLRHFFPNFILRHVGFQCVQRFVEFAFRWSDDLRLQLVEGDIQVLGDVRGGDELLQFLETFSRLDRIDALRQQQLDLLAEVNICLHFLPGSHFLWFIRGRGRGRRPAP